LRRGRADQLFTMRSRIQASRSVTLFSVTPFSVSATVMLWVAERVIASKSRRMVRQCSASTAALPVNPASDLSKFGVFGVPGGDTACGLCLADPSPTPPP
jgi:hypothetical protein